MKHPIILIQGNIRWLKRLSTTKISGMITKEQAQEMAFSYIKELYHDPVISRIDEISVGWVFYWVSAAYAKSGRFEDMLFGNGPILVDARTGTFIQLNTAPPIEHWIEEYLKKHP